MAGLSTKRSGWWWAAVPFLALLVFAADRGLEAFVRVQLEKVATTAAGPGTTVSIGRVRTRLFEGSIEVTGIAVVFDTLIAGDLLRGQRDNLLALRAERLLVKDLSYVRLFRDGAVHVALVEVDTPEVRHYFKPMEATATPADTSATAEPLPLIRVDSLVVRGAHGSSTDITGKRPSAQVANVDIHAGGLRLLPDPERTTRFRTRSATIHAREVGVALPPLYDLRIADMLLRHPSGNARLSELALVPRANEQRYHKVVHHETDLFMAAIDTIRMSGLDVARFLADAALHVEHIELFAPGMDVYRDKTMPDAPWAHKPLPTEALRELGWPLRVDTVTIRDGRVAYHERDTLNPDYGTVEFAALEGRVLGLDNSPSFAEAGGTLRIMASARVYERSTIRLEFAAPMAAANSRFSISAYLNGIPFSLFNRMTDSLLQVQATEGRIRTLTLHMHGNDRDGKGTVDMEYEGLRIAVRTHGAGGLKDKLMNLAANAVVRRDNLRSKRNYRQGEFAFDRRRDRAIFNFLWTALKRGCIDTVVPGVLRGPVSRGPERKAGKGQRV